ncbi:hypothetical protein D3C73_1230350 [compost metagenome]
MSRLPVGSKPAIHMRVSRKGVSIPEGPGYRSSARRKPETQAVLNATFRACHATPSRVVRTLNGSLGGVGPVVRSSPVFGFPARTLRPTIKSVVALARALLLSSACSPRSSVMVNGASAHARKFSVVEAVALVQIRASTVQQGREAPHSL